MVEKYNKALSTYAILATWQKSCLWGMVQNVTHGK